MTACRSSTLEESNTISQSDLPTNTNSRESGVEDPSRLFTMIQSSLEDAFRLMTITVSPIASLKTDTGNKHELLR